MLSFECIKNEKSVYFLLTSAKRGVLGQRSYGRFSYAQYPSEKPVNPADFTKNQRLGVLSWAEMRRNKLYAQQSPEPVQFSAAGQ